MFKYLNFIAGLLIFVSQSADSWQEARGTKLLLADGKIAHLVPSAVVRKTMDGALSPMADAQVAGLPDTHNQYTYVIQVGTFAVKGNALKLEKQLRNEGYHVRVWEYDSNAKNHYYVVTVGDYLSDDEARQKLRTVNLTYRVEGLLLVQGAVRQ